MLATCARQIYTHSKYRGSLAGKLRTRSHRTPQKLQTTLICKSRFSSMSQLGSDYLVWVDLEMTGLNLERDRIIEMAVIVTDKDLNLVAEGPNLVIHQEKALMDGMDEWCTKTHGESGLTKSVLESTITTEQAEETMLNFIAQYVEPGKSPLAGNSVHEDKKFLEKEMPRIIRHLHYRIVDVSSIKEVSRRWFPDTFAKLPPKKLGHRALDDIKESIEELKWYKANVFRTDII